MAYADGSVCGIFADDRDGCICNREGLAPEMVLWGAVPLLQLFLGTGWPDLPGNRGASLEGQGA